MRFAARRKRSAWVSLALILAGAVSAYAQLPTGTNVNVKQFNFVHQTGTLLQPQTQTLQVISETERTFTVTATVTGQAGSPNWLTVNGATTASGTTSQASSFVTVGVVPGSLVPGVYIGNLRVELVGLPATNIPVQFRVSASPQVSLNVPAVLIQGQAGSSVSVQIPVRSTSQPVTYTAEPVASQYQGASGWLSINPPSGTTGAAGSTNVQTILTANLTGVPAGLHYAVVNFHSTGAEPGDVSLPVILTVTQSTTVAANPARLDFAFQASNLGATTNNKVINISASPTAGIAYTATVSGDSRVSIAKVATGPGATVVSGTTPENIYVIVNPVGIPATTTVEATVNIATTSNTVNVPVRVTVTNAPLLVPSAESATFNYSLGGSLPQSQQISLTSTIGQLVFSATEAEVSGGDWLTVATNAGTTPGNLTVSLNQARLQQLAAGTYTANITITSPSVVGNSPLTIPVTLTVTGTAGFLNVTTSSGNNTLTFSADLNGAVPGNQTVTVASTDNTNRAFSISVDPASASSWVLLGQTTGETGTTGSFFTVGVSPSGVPGAGRHEADVVVTPQVAPGTPAVAQKVHVVFNVNATTSVTANPARVDVTSNGTAVPAPVTIQLTSGVTGVTFQASTEPSVSWVTVTPSSGTLGATTPIQLTFNVTGLTAGRHETAVKISPVGATEVRIPVVLTIANSQLNLSQSTININHIQGTPAPANVVVGLTSSNVAIAFTAVATSTGNWLTVTPTSGSTGATGAPPTNLTLAINPAGLAPGSYTGTVAITAANAVNSPQTVTVTLVVSTQSAPVITQVENAARNEQTLIAPGLFLAIKGTNLGPTTAVGGRVTNGAFETTAGEARVLFDGIAAPITYASATQINVIAPYSLFGRTSTRVQIEYRGIRSDAVEYRVVDVSPGIFTQNATGRGLGSVLNQNLSLNTVANPARRGEVIVIYATGEGSVRPTGADGRITTGSVENLPRPIAPVTVRINGQDVAAADILYAGAAPGIVAGVLQVNVRISPSLNISAITQVPVEVGVGGVYSQSGVTIAVAP